METRDTTPSLRASLDSNDTFVSGGHQIMKTAGATRHADRMRRVPVWALDDDRIKGLINQVPERRDRSEATKASVQDAPANLPIL